MNEERAKRKLTAILSADVRGYSRLMGEDELATIETLKKYRILISSLTEQFRGRVIDSPGDNFLVEFGSVVDAVECAVKIQEELKKENDEFPENRRMEFRIGVNLGDVVEDGERIYGDGVNIAARIEGLADGGGICISRTAYDQVKNKLSIGYEYLGEHSVKNIKDPVGVYRVLIDADTKGSVVYKHRRDDPRHKRKASFIALAILIVAVAAFLVWNFYLRHPPVEPASVDKMAFPLPDKPSIAVLPLKNISDDPKQEYFVDGMTDTLITDLSKISGLFIIASTSMFTYKGKSAKVEQIARELGVRYVLEGSVQRSDNQLRINAQLIDAKTGGHLWAERYDGKMDNIFSLQDKITQKIVSALAVKLTAGEQEQVAGKYTDNIEAYDNFLKGVGHAIRFTRDDTRQAISYYKKAIELDPNYGPAYARLGLLYSNTPGPWVDLPWPSHWIAPRYYLQSAMKSPSPDAHHLAALINLRLRRYKEAISEAERALALAPNNPDTQDFISFVLIFAGKPKEAVKFAELQMRQDPRQVYSALWKLGMAHFSMGNLEQAATYFERSLTHNPELFPNHLFLAATYAHLGRDKEAREALDNFSSLLGGWKPNLVVLMHRWPFKNPEVAERLFDGLFKAGMEGKPSGYYKILEENRLTGEEIRSLAFGREIRTACINVGVDSVNRTKDGTFMHAGYGPGKSRIVDDMLCDKWDSRYEGLEYCGTIFRNPDGTPDTNDEYIYVTDFQICVLSPVEAPPSGSYKILEENRLRERRLENYCSVGQ